jgi:hypothetical protein
VRTVSVVVLAVLGFAAAAAQALIAWAWMRSNMIQEFLSFFHGFYGYVPTWSSIAFGTQQYCWVFPTMSGLIMLATTIWRRTPSALAVAAAVAFVTTCGFIYAMYPVLDMLKVA